VVHLDVKNIKDVKVQVLRKIYECKNLKFSGLSKSKAFCVIYDFQTHGSRDSRTKLGAHSTIIQFHSYFSTSIHIGNPRGYFWIVLYKLLTLTTWIRAYFACTYSGTRAVFERGIIRGKSRGRRCLRNIRRKSCVPRPERKHTPFSFGKHSLESSPKRLRNTKLREFAHAC